MAKVAFTKLGLKTNKEVKTITFNDVSIEVLQYLPIEDKIDLLDMTLQESEINGMFDKIIMDTMFHLNLVFLYTNINFTDKQRENRMELFDKIESSGLLDLIVDAIPSEEYEYLFNLLNEQAEANLTYANSVGGILKKFIADIPENTQVLSDLIKQTDVSQLPQVVNMAKEMGLNPL